MSEISRSSLIKRLNSTVKVYLDADANTFPIETQPKNMIQKIYPTAHYDQELNKNIELPVDKPIIILDPPQDINTSHKFVNLSKRNGININEKIQFLNRAIDYDQLNVKKYIELNKYYEELLITKPILKDDLEANISLNEEIISILYESCTVPILFNSDTKKRVETNEWVLSNRNEFADFVSNNDRFIKMVENEPRETHYMWDATKSQLKDVSLFRHQKFISDFLQDNSPYRGCLLFYGLGSGKTLSSINVAEGNDRQVLIFLPASLRSNYKEDLYTKGNTIYHKQNFWCFHECVNPYIASENDRLRKMGFPVEDRELMEKIHINRSAGVKGFWTINKYQKTSNYKSFTKGERETIKKTVKALVKNKYKIVHYDGGNEIIRDILMTYLRDNDGNKNYQIVENEVMKRVLGEVKPYQDLRGSGNLEKKRELKNGILDYIYNPVNNIMNPFDNKLIIIDEVHNFISRICNGSKNSIILYELIMRSRNCKIVTLSGTPVINSPFELSILFNMLKGYTEYFNLTLKKNDGSSIDVSQIQNYFKSNVFVDLVEMNDKTWEITRIPFGFQKNPRNLNTVLKSTNSPYNIIEFLREDLLKINVKIDGLVTNSLFSPYPDLFSEKNNSKRFKIDIDNAKERFYDLYIDKTKFEIKNLDQYMRRSLGVVSFYNEISNYSQKLFPDKIHDVENPEVIYLSDYQLVSYHKDRLLEREKERLDRMKGKDQIHNIDQKTNNLFKVFSRQKLLFCFPPNIKRPRYSDFEKGVDLTSCYNLENECDFEDLNREKQYEVLCRHAISQLTKDNLTINDTSFNLSILSPKFARMLHLIKLTPGLVFGYSQFRSVEGIELFTRVLVANGFEQYESGRTDLSNKTFEIGHMVRYNIPETNQWICCLIKSIEQDEAGNYTIYKISHTGVDNIETLYDVNEQEIYKCRFALWTGSESKNLRQEILEVYKNSQNMYGQNLLILLTTSSGSEGINLKFVRQVHILEPYWNRVRIDQVIGRARRIESHILLPADQQNVTVYEYISQFTEEQLLGTWNLGQSAKQIISSDTVDLESNSKLLEQLEENLKREITNGIVRIDDKKTTDQNLLEIAKNKFKINYKFLNVIRSVAIDCVYNREDNVLSDKGLESIKCLNRLPGTNTYAYNPKKDPSPFESKETDEIQVEHQKKTQLNILPYKSVKNIDIHLLYETDEGETIETLEIGKYIPIYNFYTYYGINPLIKDFRKTKRLIGSITKQTDSYKLVLDRSFTENIQIYSGIEQIINSMSEGIPSFLNESELVLFSKKVTENKIFKSLGVSEIGNISMPTTDMKTKKVKFSDIKKRA